mgnify:CR=1 FL=1
MVCLKSRGSPWPLLQEWLINFSPGLVGGHCLPVDPYYLTYIAKKKGYKSKVTLSGRDVNDYMKKHVINFANFAIKSSRIEKNKIRKEIKQGLEKEKILNDEDKVLFYKFYKKIRKEFSEIDN